MVEYSDRFLHDTLCIVVVILEWVVVVLLLFCIVVSYLRCIWCGVELYALGCMVVALSIRRCESLFREENKLYNLEINAK